jgi:hypothetical protein
MSYCSGDEYSERIAGALERIAAILENPKTHHKTGEIVRGGRGGDVQAADKGKKVENK